MKKKLEQMLEVAELKIEMKFIDFESKVRSKYTKFLKNYE